MDYQAQDGDDQIPQRLVRPVQAMRALNVSRPTIYRLMASGDLEFVMVRNMKRIPVEAIDDYVKRLRARRASA
jgi:excisionase family DNA binding protein